MLTTEDRQILPCGNSDLNEILCRIEPDSRSSVFSSENTIRDILGIALHSAGFLVAKEVEGTSVRADLIVVNHSLL